MTDPRLNSVHLEMPRRQEFRRARDTVLGARGCETILGEQNESGVRLPTAIGRVTGLLSPGVQVWLIDSDFIYPLHVGLNTVGRSPDNDVIIQDGYISRRHCAILVHANNKVELFDTASKNGIFINGKRMQGPTQLKAGDEIRMCDRQLVFMTRSGEAAKGANTATKND